MRVKKHISQNFKASKLNEIDDNKLNELNSKILDLEEVINSQTKDANKLIGILSSKLNICLTDIIKDSTDAKKNEDLQQLNEKQKSLFSKGIDFHALDQTPILQ